MTRSSIPYSDEELTWLEARSETPRRELHAEFCKRFDRTDVSLMNLKALMKRKGWMTGRTGRFAPGQAGWNKGKKMPFNANSAKTQFKKGERQGVAADLYKPIGTERISKDGYLERKINDDMPLRRRWRAVHLINWEAENGPVPEGHCLKCLDGDKSNTDPTNWLAIPRALLPRLNGRWTSIPFDQADPEIKPLLLAVAQLKHKANETRRRRPQQL